MMKLKWLVCVDYAENVILIFFLKIQRGNSLLKKMRIKKS